MKATVSGWGSGAGGHGRKQQQGWAQASLAIDKGRAQTADQGGM